MLDANSDSINPGSREQMVHIPELIPIFPLPRTVLLPGEVLPLHIFEQRYRDLVRDTINRNRVIGMVEIAPGFEAEMKGAPPVLEVGCVGLIGQHKELEDGRFLLWLYGLQRFEIDDEVAAQTLYRMAKVSYTALQPSAGELARIEPIRRELQQLVPTLLDADEEAGDELAAHISDADDSQLVAITCQILELSSRRKRQLLEAATLLDRFTLVVEDLYRHLENNPSSNELDPSLLN